MAKVTFLTFYMDYSVGIYVLSGILKNAGHDVSVIFFKLPTKKKIDWFKEKPVNYEMVSTTGDLVGFNADVNPWCDQEVALLIEKISALSPDVLCVSCKSTDAQVALDVLPKIKSACDVLMIAGGFGPTLEPDFYADLCDYVFFGEAENCILDIVSAIENKSPLTGLNNIFYKKNGMLKKNRLVAPEVGHFKYQIIPVENYYIDNNTVFGLEERDTFMKTNAYSTFFGRGCISSCSYCTAGRMIDIYKGEGIKVQKRRNRPVEDIIEELRSIRDDGYTYIHFRDEFLYADIATLKRFFTLYERYIYLPFWAFFVPDQILNHPELLEMAVDAGFVDTEIGFQSGSDRINRQIFNRYISNRTTVDYAGLLSQYHVNAKYDFIIFNPAERAEDIRATFELIQSLPKKRAYLQLARLHYFPVSPIVDILKKKQNEHYDFERYYCIALLYLLCFVLPISDFNNLIKNTKNISSWRHLKSIYRSYVDNHKKDFTVGTHDIPDSITTHRYARIIRKNRYKNVIICGNGTYFDDMAHIFKDVNVLKIIGEKNLKDKKNKSVNLSMDRFKAVNDRVPIFICSRHKQEFKSYIQHHFSRHKGMIYV